MNIKDKNLYYIGGVVRDEILGKKSFDVDLTYVGNAIDFAKNIKNVKIVQINEDFGTVKVELDNEVIDIASTRSEFYPIKGKLPKISRIGCSLKEDVLRRDFTINALAKSTLTGEIIDYTSGLEDIKNKTLRILHDKSFIDDPTRIVRALKFSIRFGFELDENTKNLRDEYLKNVNYEMSKKRLQKELKETFDLNSQKAFEKFVNEKIYKLVTPKDFELSKVNFENLINLHKPKNVWIIYAGQVPDIENLPLTKYEQKVVNDFKNLKNLTYESDFEIYKNFSTAKLEAIIMFASINSVVVDKYLQKLSKIKLSLCGVDLIELGINSGEDFQKCFDFILYKKLENPTLTKDQELELAKIFFNYNN